jgi:hypothetical protein
MHYIYYTIKELCIKLVIKTNLYYDARSEKHQIMKNLVTTNFILRVLNLVTGVLV